MATRGSSRRIGRARAEAKVLAALVNSSDDAIIAKGLDGTVLTWNPGAERMYGYAAGEMIGRSISALVPADRRPEDRIDPLAGRSGGTP